MLLGRLLGSRRLAQKLAQTPNVDPRVAEAMIRVGRHRYVGWRQLLFAYDDRSLPIGFGQPISQPTFIAEVISAARIKPSDHVLEVGAGSGFAAAVLGQLAREVVTVERIDHLAAAAARRLNRHGARNVRVVAGDGWLASGVEGLFDVILIAAGAPRVPASAVARLAAFGRLIIPVGNLMPEGHVDGRLLRITLRDGAPIAEDLCACAWVPLFGDEGWPRASGNRHAIDPSDVRARNAPGSADGLVP